MPRRLEVISRTTVNQYGDSDLSAQEIGRELNAGSILEGSVRRQGDRIRVVAQLIDTRTEAHLWSETFDRKLENIFAVQEEIAMAIAGILVGKLGGAVDMVPNQTRNMAAYDTYLKGRAALRRRDEEAIDLLEQATAADPDEARRSARVRRLAAHDVGGRLPARRRARPGADDPRSRAVASMFLS